MGDYVESSERSIEQLLQHTHGHGAYSYRLVSSYTSEKFGEFVYEYWIRAVVGD
jgi:hypothetical protein